MQSIGEIALSPPLALLVASVIALAASGFAALPLARRPRVADRTAAGIFMLGIALGLCSLAAWLAGGAARAIHEVWPVPRGSAGIALDGLSACFLLPILVVAGAATIYGHGYWPAAEHPATAAKLRVFLGLLTAAMELLVVARDGLTFLLAFEVMTLAAFFLVTTEDERDEVRRAGWIYLVAAHASLMFLIAAFALLRSGTGSLELTPEAARELDRGTGTVILVLALLGFGIKAGLVPLHVWLPAAHAAAPSHVSALLSGVVIKTGIYGLARFTAVVPEPPSIFGLALLFLGAVSGLLGVAYALGQHDLKRLLAYHSIENVGIIVMGLGVALLGRSANSPALVVLGIAAALMHVWNHALFKSLLFLSGGALVRALGTREMDAMGALSRRMPWSAALFTVGAVAICGLPPLNGFISELFLYTAALRSAIGGGPSAALLAAPVLALIGALACACFIKVVGAVFLGHPRTEAVERARECGWTMRAPMLALAGLCALLGLAPICGTPLLDAGARAWAGDLGPELPSLRAEFPFGALASALAALTALLAGGAFVFRARRSDVAAPTWGCGFGASSPRLQYSGSSLARGLVRFFRPLVRVEEHAPCIEAAFPRASAFEAHVEDVTLQRILLPFCAWVAERFMALRRWQTGRIQTYVLYMVVTTLGLMLFVVPIRRLFAALLDE